MDGHQHDAHEMLHELLETLHAEIEAAGAAGAAPTEGFAAAAEKVERAQLLEEGKNPDAVILARKREAAMAASDDASYVWRSCVEQA